MHLQICASLQVCKFTPLQNLEIANFQFNKMQVHICKFASLQIYTITKSRNCKFQFNKMQVHICKFASLQIFKIKKSKKLQFNNYIFTTLQIASVHLQVHKFASSQN